jgi:DNA-directed RNA polymerase beta subunit
LPCSGIDYSTPEKTVETNYAKAMYLGYLTKVLLLVAIGERPLSDIDDFSHRRARTCGMLLATQLRQLIRQFVKTLHGQIYKSRQTKSLNILELFRNNKIWQSLGHAKKPQQPNGRLPNPERHQLDGAHTKSFLPITNNLHGSLASL